MRMRWRGPRSPVGFGRLSARNSSLRLRIFRPKCPPCEVRCGSRLVGGCRHGRVTHAAWHSWHRSLLFCQCGASCRVHSLPGDLSLANERCISIEMEVRQEVSEEMATRLQELEERYHSMQAQETVAAEVRKGPAARTWRHCAHKTMTPLERLFTHACPALCYCLHLVLLLCASAPSGEAHGSVRQED